MKLIKIKLSGEYKGGNKMILNKEQLNQLSVKTKSNLLMVLYGIEDELDYECEDISETINYLQGEE